MPAPGAASEIRGRGSGDLLAARQTAARQGLHPRREEITTEALAYDGAVDTKIAYQSRTTVTSNIPAEHTRTRRAPQLSS